jgi:hypothetical protein
MDYKDRSEYRYEFFTRYEDNGLILLEDEYILDVNRLIYEKQSITLNKVTITHNDKYFNHLSKNIKFNNKATIIIKNRMGQLLDRITFFISKVVIKDDVLIVEYNVTNLPYDWISDNEINIYKNNKVSFLRDFKINSILE